LSVASFFADYIEFSVRIVTWKATATDENRQLFEKKIFLPCSGGSAPGVCNFKFVFQPAARGGGSHRGSGRVGLY
jgi:hypothetical protein